MTDSTLRSRLTSLFRSVFSTSVGGRFPRTSRRRASRRYRRLSAEPLEERTVLAATVGVYDENVVATNTVDFVAAGSTVDNAQFAAAVAADFQNNLGGVINASVLSIAGYDYGASQNKSLNLIRAEGTNYGLGGATGPAQAISLTGAFASSLEGTYAYTSFDFQILNGGSGERVIEFGVTVLSFTGRDYGNVTVTGRLASGGTISASRAISEDGGLGDTFYGLTAPGGDHFTGFSISYDSGIDQAIWFDDIGFRTVAPGNQPPQALNDLYFQFEDTPLDVAAPGVLANDTDPNQQDELTAQLVEGPVHGTLQFNADGSFSYTPDANYNGDDTFTYRAVDPSGSLSNLAQVTIRLRPVADPPAVDDATFAIDENSPVNTPVGTVTASDPEGGPLAFAITAGNESGAFAIDPATGAITVADSAPLDFESTPQFNLTVRATDSTGLAGEATITINLRDVAETLSVAIDVEPRDDTNSIDLKKDKQIAVVIFSTATFDATQEIDLDSLTFGVTGDEASLVRHHRHGVRYQVRDVDGDGRLDLIVQSDTEAAGFAAGDTQAVLKGRLLDGTMLEGLVAISVEDSSNRRGNGNG